MSAFNSVSIAQKGEQDAAQLQRDAMKQKMASAAEATEFAAIKDKYSLLKEANTMAGQ